MMNKSRKTLFISDLHLDENNPNIAQLFLQLLKECQPTSTDALYILGDLFEVWIGDDHHTTLHDKVIQALKTVTQNGVPVYLLHGNRDFLLGKHFLQQTGCTLFAEEEKIMTYGQPVLLMHGDTLCTQDHVYLKMRKVIRHPIVKKWFLMLPLKIRQYLAHRLRIKSTQYTQSTVPTIMDVTQEAVEQVMRHHAAYCLIHGHTHRPYIHHFMMDHMPAMRIVLGAWHEQGNAFVWHDSGKKELIYFNQVTPLEALHNVRNIL